MASVWVAADVECVLSLDLISTVIKALEDVKPLVFATESELVARLCVDEGAGAPDATAVHRLTTALTSLGCEPLGVYALTGGEEPAFADRA